MALGGYVGSLLIEGQVTKKHFTFILDKIHQRLHGWSANKLSLAGRVTLINSTSNSLSSFIMQTNVLLSSICSEIDKLTRKFL